MAVAAGQINLSEHLREHRPIAARRKRIKPVLKTKTRGIQESDKSFSLPVLRSGR